MKREIYKDLIKWKNSHVRKPLILMGARQVGKTTILSGFAKNEYSNFIYLNFEFASKITTLLQETLDPNSIIKALEIETGKDIIAGETLIIFDEIQECPEALNSLKYFYEQTPEYHVCAAGSLLGVQLSKQKGFPVGKVDFKHLYPLSFIEFLQALGETKLIDYLFDKIDLTSKVPTIIHGKLLNHFKSYLLVGGMPEPVYTFCGSEDYNKVRTIQNNILQSYSLDFAKHAPHSIIMKINQVWQSIPNQLAKENNKKFVYSIIRGGARAKDFESAIQWLVEAGLINKVYNLSAPKLPIKAYADFKYFKIYLSDVGLLAAKADLPIKTILNGDELFTEFKGALIENYAAQSLARQDYGLYYWTSDGRAEVDFIIQHESDIIPLEIKSGLTSKKKSLNIYESKYKPKLLIRSSPMNLKLENKLVNYPLYLLDILSCLISSD